MYCLLFCIICSKQILIWHKPKSVIRPTLFILFRFFRSLYAILAFLSASCPHPRLAVARYVFASDAANLLETNTNLA